ncbi:TldD/PmbA family protein [Salinispora arenicola]|uniref:TldD/PmbA family protein n=1 Tax=Salinispora arenicola TaxID=168697 RepID=UPI000370B65E|nr:TldD/PmbA family protein [Salinispora arenicola]
MDHPVPRRPVPMTTRPRRAIVREPGFDTLPADRLTAAALHRASRLGARYADVRLRRVRTLRERVRDARPEGSQVGVESGAGVRVLVNGTWGFAAGPDLSVGGLAELAARACELARMLRPLRRDPVRLAPEPVGAPATWESPCEVDPFEVPAGDRVALLAGWCEALRAGGLDLAEAYLQVFRESTVYRDSAGRSVRQRRTWLHPMAVGFRIDSAGGGFDSMRTLGPPIARGWEYLRGTGWDWAAELARMPRDLAAKRAAPPVEPGVYDLVIDPTNLWLTIHETVGHATELDRMLGREAAFAGRSFVTPEDVGTLRYGSPAMTVIADRTTPYGLATVGYDDEGVAARSWPLIAEGVLVGVQHDRQTAGVAGLDRSTGCAYAESYRHLPVQRMPNVSLCAVPGGPDTAELIGRVRDGLYVVGDNSFSVDMERVNFQFTAQRFYRIRDGRLDGQVRDAAYTGATLEFWRSLEAVGGPQTWLLSGASQCGKAQPLQLAAAGHGCPAALFRQVRVTSTRMEVTR